MNGCQDIIGSNPSVFLDKRFTKIEKEPVFAKPIPSEEKQAVFPKDSVTRYVPDLLWYTDGSARGKAMLAGFA